MGKKTYADQLVEMLKILGYTHCFFVAGGNIMHLLNAARTRMVCVPFVHEVSAGIAAEYFNELRPPSGGRAFALVTAGPGLTNIITALAGAWLESRELLVIGGQVKSSDLRGENLRQRGIQEVDGIKLAAPVCKATLQITRPVPLSEVVRLIHVGTTPRKGPVFLEICIDAQGAQSDDRSSRIEVDYSFLPSQVPSSKVDEVARRIKEAKRPLFLIGGGLDYEEGLILTAELSSKNLPIMTTYNGSDRVNSRLETFFGRPNTWGQRSANVLLQQADLLICVGTRLGLQQTGFNWEAFGEMAYVVQVDLDPHELDKGHPRVDMSLHGDAAGFLKLLLRSNGISDWMFTNQSWLDFCRKVRELLPLSDQMNTHDSAQYVDVYDFVLAQNSSLPDNCLMIPCSSGGAFTVTMQTFEPRGSQRLICNKSLASMGYGLAGAIGAALAWPDRTVVLNEGDGGFAQNLQELGTVGINQLNIKIFIWANDGYASIRMTQKNYFEGAWIGCDTRTGVGLPNWRSVADSFGLKYARIDPLTFLEKQISHLVAEEGPILIELPIDPTQTYYPKISSTVNQDGSIMSAPLHLMTPELEAGLAKQVFLSGDRLV